MILYLDTSSLAKIYVIEPGSDEVRALVARATVVATSQGAYPEMRAALARRRSSFDDRLNRAARTLARALARVR